MVLPITYRMFDKTMEEKFSDTIDLLHIHSRVACVMLCDPEYVKLIDVDIANSTELNRKELSEDRQRLLNHSRWKKYCSETYPIVDEWLKNRNTTNEVFICAKYVEIVRKYIPCCKIYWAPSKNESSLRSKSEIVNRSSNRRKANGGLDNFMKYIIENIKVINNVSISEILFKTLDDYCKQLDMLPSSLIRTMPLNQKTGKRGPYSMNDLTKLLKISGNAAYYADKWKIAMIWWGWEPYKFDNDVEQDLKNKYNTMSNISSQRSMNRGYLAIRFLTNCASKINRKIDISDFDVISTPSILQTYERTYYDTIKNKKLTWTKAPLYGSW